MWEKVKPYLPSRNASLALLLGQFLSVLLTSTGVSSQYLSTFGVDCPTAQTFLNYVLLSFYSLNLIYHKTFVSGFKARWWQYALLALADVEANYMVVKAYQYTNITSVTLLDCFSIPSVMCLSYFLRGTRYRPAQYVAVLICLAGLGVLVASDAVHNHSAEGGSNQVLGDFLVLGGAFLYACSNLGQEVQVNAHSSFEFLAFLGLFGSAISFCQLMVLERHELETLTWSWKIGGLFLLYGLSMFLLYSLTPLLLQLGNATLMNLSFLTSDVFSVVAGMVLFGLEPSLLYFVAFMVIVGGLVLYNLRLRPPVEGVPPAEEGETPLSPEAAPPSCADPSERELRPLQPPQSLPV